MLLERGQEPYVLLGREAWKDSYKVCHEGISFGVLIAGGAGILDGGGSLGQGSLCCRGGRGGNAIFSVQLKLTLPSRLSLTLDALHFFFSTSFGFCIFYA